MEESENTGEHVEAAAQPVSDENYEQAEVAEPKEETVPISALQAERKQRQELQENMKMLQDHLELVKANSSQKPAKEEEFSQYQDDDVLTFGEAKKFMSSLKNSYETSISELRMQQSYPDYTETVKKYLPDVLKEEPELRDDIQNAKNPYKLAYYLAKKSQGYIQDHKQQEKNKTAERILENSNRSGNLSAVGQTAPASSSKAWKYMSDDEFMKHVSRHMGSV